MNQIDRAVKPILWLKLTTFADNISQQHQLENQAVLKRKIAATTVAAIFTPETEQVS